MSPDRPFDGEGRGAVPPTSRHPTFQPDHSPDLGAVGGVSTDDRRPDHLRQSATRAFMVPRPHIVATYHASGKTVTVVVNTERPGTLVSRVNRPIADDLSIQGRDVTHPACRVRPFAAAGGRRPYQAGRRLRLFCRPFRPRVDTLRPPGDLLRPPYRAGALGLTFRNRPTLLRLTARPSSPRVETHTGPLGARVGTASFARLVVTSPSVGRRRPRPDSRATPVEAVARRPFS